MWFLSGFSKVGFLENYALSCKFIPNPLDSITMGTWVGSLLLRELDLYTGGGAVVYMGLTLTLGLEYTGGGGGGRLRGLYFNLWTINIS